MAKISSPRGHMPRMLSHNEGSTFGLSPDEQVVKKVEFITTQMTRSERLACVLTMGIYWLFTRCWQKQVRKLTYTITDKRIIQKEEVTGRRFCSRKQKVFECEVAFPIARLAYIRHEVVGTPSITLDAFASVGFHFMSYPSPLERLSNSTYASTITRIARFMKTPLIKAMQDAFGLDYSGSAEDLAASALRATERLSDPSSYITFLVCLLKETLKALLAAVKEFLNAMWTLAKAPLGTSPAMLTGKASARAITITIRDCDMKDGQEQVLQVIKAVLENVKRPRSIGHGNIFKEAMNVERKPLAQVSCMHATDGKHMLVDELMPMYPDEQCISATDYNYTMSLWDKVKTAFTLGFYYLLKLYDAMEHRNSVLLMPSRLVAVRSLFTKAGKIEHLLSECFFIGQGHVSTVILDGKRNLVRDAHVIVNFGTAKGTIQLGSDEDCNIVAIDKFANLISLMATASGSAKLPGLTPLERTEREDAFLQHNFTMGALMPGEQVVQAIRADDDRGGCCAKLKYYAQCGLLGTHAASSCMITESRAVFASRSSNSRGWAHWMQVFVPYDKINGIYWSNFYYGDKEKAFENGTAKAKSRAGDAHYGAQGLELRVSIGGGKDLSIGITAEALYYGGGIVEVDQVVQTLAKHVLIGTAAASSKGPGIASPRSMVPRTVASTPMIAALDIETGDGSSIFFPAVDVVRAIKNSSAQAAPAATKSSSAAAKDGGGGHGNSAGGDVELPDTKGGDADKGEAASSSGSLREAVQEKVSDAVEGKIEDAFHEAVDGATADVEATVADATQDAVEAVEAAAEEAAEEAADKTFSVVFE